MFKKVLIVEDRDDANRAIYEQLKELGVQCVDQAQYCDDALLKIQKALLDKAPYELLITDLSFEKDHREQKYNSGEALIKAIRAKQIDVAIIVYSGNDHLQVVRNLIHNLGVDAYVCKGREGLRVDLKKSIQYVFSNTNLPFVSHRVKNALKKSANHTGINDITDYDIQILKKLSEGYSQQEISTHFTKNNISPKSLSSVEKRINRLKDLFKSKNPAQLVAVTKDLGLI